MRLRLLPLVLGGGLLLAGVASADEAPTDPEKIRAAADEFDAGSRAYKGRNFEEAAAHFENANLAAPNPEALRSAIRSRMEAKQPGRAATLAALALARYGDDAGVAKYARSVVADNEGALVKLRVLCAPACSLAVDGRVVPIPDAAEATVFVDAGSHTVVAGWSSSRTQANDVDAVAGSATELRFTAPTEPTNAVPAGGGAPGSEDDPPPPGPAPEPPKPHGGLSPVVFYAGAGATALLAGVTIWSGLDAKSNPGPDAVRAQCVGQGESCSLYQDGLAKQTRTNVLLGVTGVVGLATAIVGALATDWSSSGASVETPDTAKLGPKLSPVVSLADGAYLGAMGTF